MRLIRVIVALTAAVLLTAPPGATAASSTPFRSDFAAQASFAETSVPGVFTVTTSGAGHASHLGRVTLSTMESLDFAASPGSLVIRDGRLVMIAANGDELRWTYEGTGSLPDEDGDSTLTGTFVISGGTGRFSDATGSGTFQGTGNAVTGAASLSYRGTISY